MRLDPEGWSSRQRLPSNRQSLMGTDLQRAQVLEIMRTDETRSRCVAAVACDDPADVPRLAPADAPADVSCPPAPAPVDDDPEPAPVEDEPEPEPVVPAPPPVASVAVTST